MEYSMNFKNTNIGCEIEFSDYLILFGNRNATFERIKNFYPFFSFIRIKQTHSDIIINSIKPEDDLFYIGDAHWTEHKQLGLLISTADCLPIFLEDPITHKVAGIHAGWRGVAQKIVSKTLKQMDLSNFSHIQVYIGPHIQKESFEIDQPVLDEILKSLDKNSLMLDEIKKQHEKVYSYNESSKKFYLDLASVLKLQLIELGVDSKNINSLEINTVTNENFHSFRRDREKSGRQLSFIIKK